MRAKILLLGLGLPLFGLNIQADTLLQRIKATTYEAPKMECTLHGIAKEGTWRKRSKDKYNYLYFVSKTMIVFGNSLFTYSYSENNETVEAYDAYWNGTSSYLTIGTNPLISDVVITTPDGLTGMGYSCKKIDTEKNIREMLSDIPISIQ